MIIAVDFDGTLVEHAYPEIGAELDGAFQCLMQLQAAGAQLILWTMRSGLELEEAVAFCRERGVNFWGVNKNPTQSSWTNSPKAYAQLYIDDAAAGTPVQWTERVNRYSVDWETLTPILTRITGVSISR